MANLREIRDYLNSLPEAELERPATCEAGEIGVWPRLSRTLPPPKYPGQCQACGATWDLDRWREHDEADEPDRIVVVLCLECSDKIIGPHPRLYEPLHRNEPFPGCMDICANCRHRDGFRCASPAAMANGGEPPGIELMAGQVERTSWHGADAEGEPIGGVWLEWSHPVSKCSGRDAMDLSILPIA